MREPVGQHLRAGLMVVGAAVILAIGVAGGAVAAHKITSSDIKNHTIRGVDIHRRTIGTGRLTPAAVAALGGVPGYQIVTTPVSVPPATTGDYYDSTVVTATCPAGKQVLGGGFAAGTISTDVVVANSLPDDHGTAWTVYVHNGEANAIESTAYAICAAVS